MRRARLLPQLLCAASISLAPYSAGLAAEAVAPPVLYPADLWQGRGEAVLRVLNRADSHIETLTIPVGGQAHYRSLRLGVTRCVERPETLPSDAAALIATSDDTDPDAHYEGWILAQEPSLSSYKSALYGIAIISCAGPKTDPALAPLPQSVAPEISTASPEGAQNQPGDLNDPGQQPGQPSGQASPAPQTLPGGLPSSPSGGPTTLAPLGAPAASPPRAVPTAPQNPGQESGGPMQLSPLGR
ncbi:DUF2155 domain-containing protein [Asaia astilbis]|uniref:DUF2155 domain-containing protein n=1 Tax=Asaia astilbis TaxID=610244 RepID=UPI00047108AA|nr:DUF2155 domain-containing protein [Asaia astilbis]